jgi:hypothetical protein
MAVNRDEVEAPVLGDMSYGGSLSTQMLFSYPRCPVPTLRPI